MGVWYFVCNTSTCSIFKFKLRTINLDETATRLGQNCLESHTRCWFHSKMEECIKWVSAGFAPGLALLSACINDLDDGIQNILIKFADCACLRRIKRSCKDRVRIQYYLEKLIWRNRMLLKRNKCKVLHEEKGKKNCRRGFWGYSGLQAESQPCQVDTKEGKILYCEV